MNLSFIPSAKVFWNKIPPDIRKLLLDNVYCTQCRSRTIITDCSLLHIPKGSHLDSTLNKYADFPDTECLLILNVEFLTINY